MVSAIVAYTDPQGVFRRYETLVESNLRHLTNLYWRPPASSLDALAQATLSEADTTVRTITSLALQLAPEGTHRPRQHQIPGLNNSPFVQILVIETAPLDIYRSKLRQIGREWFQKQVEVREPTGYVVVHAISDKDNVKAAKAIWSRLTAEFDPANCIQLNPASKQSWLDLKHLVQEQLLTAFDARIEMLGSEIKKLKATRDIPGWNFGTLFALNESLAWAFESMNLLDDALRVYTCLEVMVNEISPENWSSQVQTHTLSFAGERDVLIDLMITQRASLFDIQRHFLARKVSLVLNMAASKRQKEEMVDSLADRLVLYCITLAVEKFPALMGALKRIKGSWNAYLWLLKAVRDLFVLVTENGSSKLAQGKGDLILIERDAIQKLGALKGWSIPGVFNEISLSSKEEEAEEAEEEKEKKEEGGATNVDESFSIENEEDLQTEYIRLTQQALGYYRVAGLQRVVTRLTAQLLTIEFYKGNIETAWDLWKKTPFVNQLSSKQQPIISLLDIALSCAEKMGLDDEIDKISWNILGLAGNVPRRLVEKAVSKIQDSPLKATAAATHDLGTWFNATVYPYLRGDESGYFIEVLLKPLNPDYPFVSLDRAVVVAHTTEELTGIRKTIVFESSEVTTDKLKLYTKTFEEGLVELEKLELAHGSHILETGLGAARMAMTPLSTAFNASVVLAKTHTMRKRNIELRLTSPQKVSHARVQINSVDQDLQLLWDKAEGTDMLVNFKDTVIQIPVLVDHEHSVTRLKIKVDYDGSSFVTVKTLDFSLAVSVDFQEYLRQPSVILSQFFVKPFSHVPIVFSSGKLSGSCNYEVDENYAKDINEDQYIAYNNAPISYVFRIKKTDSDPKKARSMELKITYRSLLWECQQVLFGTVLAALTSQNLQCYSATLGHIVEKLSNHVSIAQYITSGIVKIENVKIIAETVNAAFQYMDPEHAALISSLVSEKFTNGVPKNETDFESLNSTMMLEVPDPDAEIVHYVELDLLGAKDQRHLGEHVVGEVIPASLKIQTLSFQNNDISDHVFEYDFDRLSEGWSYTGKVKGIFKGNGLVREQVNLIPNRSGELLVPNVVVKRVDPGKNYNGDKSDSESVLTATEEEEGEEGADGTVVVAKHANTRVLVVPDVNMLAITF